MGLGVGLIEEGVMGFMSERLWEVVVVCMGEWMFELMVGE